MEPEDSNRVINSSGKISSRFIIKDAINIMHHLGFIKEQEETLGYKLFRYSVRMMLSVLATKCSTFLIMYLLMNEEQIKSHERVFINLGDYAYFIPQIRIHWNAMTAIACCSSFIPYMLHMKNGHKRSNWIDLLDCIIGQINPAEIGLNLEEDVVKLLKR
jgi:hypothetical protein